MYLLHERQQERLVDMVPSLRRCVVASWIVIVPVVMSHRRCAAARNVEALKPQKRTDRCRSARSFDRILLCEHTKIRTSILPGNGGGILRRRGVGQSGPVD